MTVAQGLIEKGKYVTTWKKQAGVWKVAEDIFNPDGSAPALHTMIAPDQLEWVDGPASLPPGIKVAVISGDSGRPRP